MAKGLGISGILNPESIAQARGTHTVSYIGIDKIRAHDKNRHYDEKKVELLARDIEDIGLQSPIVVAATGNDRYVVISGHRRLAAFRLLAAEGKEQFGVIPAICRTGLTAAAVEEMLYDGNLFTEMPTDGELAAQLAWKKQRLLERKAAGEKIGGKMLELISEELGIKAEAARRMDRVNRTAIPEVQKEFAAGSISLHEAYQTARQPPDKQQELLKKRRSGEIAHMYEDDKGVNLHPETAAIDIGEGVNLHPETAAADTNEGVNLHLETKTDEPEKERELRPDVTRRCSAEPMTPLAAKKDVQTTLRELQALMNWAQQTDQPERLRQHLYVAHAELCKASALILATGRTDE